MTKYDELFQKIIGIVNEEILQNTPLETIYGVLATTSMCVQEAMFNKLTTVRSLNQAQSAANLANAANQETPAQDA